MGVHRHFTKYSPVNPRQIGNCLKLSDNSRKGYSGISKTTADQGTKNKNKKETSRLECYKNKVPHRKIKIKIYQKEVI